jgi:hypothetical protein
VIGPLGFGDYTRSLDNLLLSIQSRTRSTKTVKPHRFKSVSYCLYSNSKFNDMINMKDDLLEMTRIPRLDLIEFFCDDHYVHTSTTEVIWLNVYHSGTMVLGHQVLPIMIPFSKIVTIITSGQFSRLTLTKLREIL